MGKKKKHKQSKPTKKQVEKFRQGYAESLKLKQELYDAPDEDDDKPSARDLWLETLSPEEYEMAEREWISRQNTSPLSIAAESVDLLTGGCVDITALTEQLRQQHADGTQCVDTLLGVIATNTAQKAYLLERATRQQNAVVMGTLLRSAASADNLAIKAVLALNHLQQQNDSNRSPDRTQPRVVNSERTGVESVNPPNELPHLQTDELLANGKTQTTVTGNDHADKTVVEIDRAKNRKRKKT